MRKGGTSVGRRKKKKKEKEKNNQFHSSSNKILGSGHVVPRKNPWVLQRMFYLLDSSGE